MQKAHHTFLYFIVSLQSTILLFYCSLGLYIADEEKTWGGPWARDINFMDISRTGHLYIPFEVVDRVCFIEMGEIFLILSLESERSFDL